MSHAHRLSPGSLGMILLNALFCTAAEVALKVGATETADHPVALPWLGLSGLGSKWVWLGIVLTVLSFWAWIRAVRVVPLSIAFTLSNVVHAFIPLSCWLILGEAISPRRWCGIALVLAGLAVVARPFASLEDKIEHSL